MGDFMHDPTGLRSTTDRSGSIARRCAFILAGCIAAALLAFGAWSHWHRPKPAAKPAPAAETSSKPMAAVAPAPEPELSAEEKAEDEAQMRRRDLEYQVRQAMCEDYGQRYLKARTGVDLVRTVQLSQAAGCDWSAMLKADAATHDFLPEALEVAQSLSAEEVPTAGSRASEDADRIEVLSRKIDDIDRKTDELRWRVR